MEELVTLAGSNQESRIVYYLLVKYASRYLMPSDYVFWF